MKEFTWGNVISVINWTPQNKLRVLSVYLWGCIWVFNAVQDDQAWLSMYLRMSECIAIYRIGYSWKIPIVLLTIIAFRYVLNDHS